MKIRRTVSKESFQKELKAANAGSPYLPILVLEEHKNQFTRSVGKSFAALVYNREIEWSSDNLPDLQNHVVVALNSDVTADLGKCYSRITNRPFIELTHGLKPYDNVKISKYKSATVIVPFDLDNSFKFLHNICKKITAYLEEYNRIGFLVAEDVEILSWLILKQLSHLTNPKINSVIIPDFLIDTSLKGISSCDTRDETIEEICRRIDSRRSALFMQGHARCHCGFFSTKEGPIGICGSPSKGEDGKCFDGSHCFFEDKPKISMEQIETNVLFYNGCSTIKLSPTPYGIPMSANLGLSALRGQISYLIGNYCMGRYSEWDMIWFLVLSYLSYPPATSVYLINNFRRIQRLEFNDSLIFVGDAATQNLTVSNVSVADVKIKYDQAWIMWNKISSVLIAVIHGTTWARLADRDLLDVQIEPLNIWNHCQASMMVDDKKNVTIVAMVVSDSLLDHNKISLRLIPRTRPFNRKVGDLLSSSRKNIAFAMRCDAFKDKINDLYENMTNELFNIRRFVSNRRDIIAMYDKVNWAHIIEEKVAASADARLIEIACSMASSRRWNWEEEYANNVWTECLNIPGVCPLCSQLVHKYVLHDFIDPDIHRCQSICVECGLIADLPLWPIEAKLSRTQPQWDGNIFQDELEMINIGKERCFVTTRQIINSLNCYVTEDQSNPIVLNPGQSVCIRLSLRVLEPISGFYWVRAYLSCFGGLGFVSRPFLF